jgi:hypothetical protein
MKIQLPEENEDANYEGGDDNITSAVYETEVYRPPV